MNDHVIYVVFLLKDILAIYFCIRMTYLSITKLNIWYKCNSRMLEDYNMKQHSDWNEKFDSKNKKNKKN